MGATPAKPLGESETKAFLNFMKFFKKEHSDLEESEIDKCGTDTWGKLMPDQKKLFAVSSLCILFKKDLKESAHCRLSPHRLLPAAKKRRLQKNLGSHERTSLLRIPENRLREV